MRAVRAAHRRVFDDGNRGVGRPEHLLAERAGLVELVDIRVLRPRSGGAKDEALARESGQKRTAAEFQHVTILFGGSQAFPGTREVARLNRT